MKKERLKITCEELPNIFITDTTPEEIKKMGLNKIAIKEIENFDKNYLYHLENYCFRAMRKDEILGMMVLAPKHEKSKKDEILYLSIVYVYESHRRQGIGHFLLMTAAAMCQAMGYKSLFFESDVNLPNSVPFCEAMIKHLEEDYNSKISRIS